MLYGGDTSSLIVVVSGSGLVLVTVTSSSMSLSFLLLYVTSFWYDIKFVVM